MRTAPFGKHDRLGARPVSAPAQRGGELGPLLAQCVRDLLRPAQSVLVATATIVGHTVVFTHAPARPPQASTFGTLSVPETQPRDGA